MSPTLQRVLKSINYSQLHCELLSPDETMTALKEMSKISEDELVITKIVQYIYHTKAQVSKIETLSKREQQVFNLIGLALTSKEIGRLLKISEATVSTHRKHISKKLRLKGAGQLQKVAYGYLQDHLKKVIKQDIRKGK